MRWPARVLRLPLTALQALRRLVRARAGMEPPPLRCLACGSLASRCLCMPGPTLDEPIGDESDRPTLRESARAKAMVPGPPKVPSRFPPPPLRKGPPRRKP